MFSLGVLRPDLPDLPEPPWPASLAPTDLWAVVRS